MMISRAMLNDIQNNRVCHLDLDCKTVFFSLKIDFVCEPHTSVSFLVTLTRCVWHLLHARLQKTESCAVYSTLSSKLKTNDKRPKISH